MSAATGLDAVGDLTPRVAEDAAGAGDAAATAAAAAIRAAISARGEARVVFASAPSQEEMLAALVSDSSIDWSRVHALHMDEYVGLPDDHPQSFGNWLRVRLSAVELGSFERIRPGEHAAEEAARYAALVASGPIDLTCMGIGVNGHIAFNEPHTSWLDDPELVRVVVLDETSRRQQVDEGLFGTIDDVPTHAVSLTVPALLRSEEIVVTAHGRHKAAAVAAAFNGPVAPACPASALRTHRSVSVHVDKAAASQLDRRP